MTQKEIIKVMRIDGVIEKQELTKDQIDLSELSNGIYLITIGSEELIKILNK